MTTHAESKARLLVLGAATLAILASLAFLLWSLYGRVWKPLEAL